MHTPEVYTDIEKTDLRIWNIDFADSYPELEDEAKDILRVILKGNIPISVSKIRERTGGSDYKVRKWLEILDEKKLVQKVGSGPVTKYTVRETSDEKITQLQIALDNLEMLDIRCKLYKVTPICKGRPDDEFDFFFKTDRCHHSAIFAGAAHFIYS